MAPKCCTSCYKNSKEWLYDLLVVVNKHLRIRRRRYVATALEILAPIFVVIVLTIFNTRHSIFRTDSRFARHTNGSSGELEKYDIGHQFDLGYLIDRFELCSRPSDRGLDCSIWYVCDDETDNKIMNHAEFRAQFTHIIFTRFRTESQMEECISNPDACRALQHEHDKLLALRAAIVFETGVNDMEIRYKLRFLERYYDSLANVFKTDRVEPSVYDRAEFIKGYTYTGFLSLQLRIDQQIIRHIKRETNDPYIDIDKGNESQCACELKLVEIPHRRVDQRHSKKWLKDSKADDYTEDDAEASQHETYVKRSLIISTIMVLSFAFLIPSAQRSIMTEKESGLKVLLLVTGMTHRQQWIGALLASGCAYSISIALIVFLVKIPFNMEEGAVFADVGAMVLFPLFLLHTLALASASYLFTVFFERPVLCITLTTTIWVTSFVIPVYHIDLYYDYMPIWLKLLLCLHPSIAFHFGIKFLVNFEKEGVFLFFWDVGREIEFDTMRLVYVYLALMLDIFLYLVMTIYLDRVLKTKNGITKPWYYPFLLREWVDKHPQSKVAPGVTASAPLDGFEKYPENVKPSVITTKLSKKYGSVLAVDNLNVNLFHGEIFALLGQNGAGKSTMLGLICGYVGPSSGTANVSGYDITTHMTQIQAFTGFCPQTNCIYDDLTAREHFLIFGQLRGLRGTEAEEETSELLDRLRLTEMSKIVARKLSKGDQRKLCLGNALIGNPKAELLGDKIGILSNGRMQLCGSQPFLRRQFDFGYSLRMNVEPQENPDPERILQVVRDFLPNATLNKLALSPFANRVCCVNLPMEGYSTNRMAALFTVLAKLKESLGITGFSVSLASMDEVFLALTKKLNPTDEISIEGTEHGTKTEERKAETFKAKQSCCLLLIHFYALLKKKIMFTFRKRSLLFLQVSVPISIFILSFYRLSLLVQLNGRSAPALTISLHSYKSPITLYYPSENYTHDLCKAVIGPSAVPNPDPDLSTAMIKVPFGKLKSRYIIGLKVDYDENRGKQYIFMYSTAYFLHAAPLAANTYTNLLVQKMDSRRKVTVINHPFQHPYFTGPEVFEDPQAEEMFAVSVTLGLSILIACCVLFPVEEKLNQVKHMQLMSGVSSITYWLAIFLCDLVIVGAVIASVLIFTALYEPTQIFTRNGRRDSTTIGLLLILFSFSYAGIMIAYFVSLFTRSVSGGFAFITVLALFFGVMLPFFSASEMPAGFVKEGFLYYATRMVPIYSLAAALSKYAGIVVTNGKCNHFTEDGADFYCKRHTGLQDYGCCTNCFTIPGARECIDQLELLRFPWKYFPHKYSSHDDYESEPTEHEHEVDGVEHRSAIPEILFMVFVGLIFNILTVFLDSDASKYLEAWIFGLRGSAFQTDVEDEDIQTEEDKVADLVKHEKFDEEALISYNLCKTYGIFPAVHNINLAVHHGESFGILGVNGAGKSTFFKLLTATTAQTFGNAYSADCSLTRKRGNLLRKIGYSPHTGGSFISYLNPKELLYFFCRIRGLSIKESKKEVEEQLRRMDLKKFVKLSCAHLSGGTKRKLSCAIAVIADPAIVIFDEPTSSADPASRKIYWDSILERQRLGQTVLFSSHRINECEALCQRIGIMVDGKFICLGTPDHLKDKFGQGFKLMIKLFPGAAENQGYISSLSDTVVSTFNPCTLRDRRRNVVQYVIHDFRLSWDFLFTSMEHVKLRYNDLVEDYAFSNTTLEEVFLSFVVLQNCGRLPDTTGCAC